MVGSSMQVQNKIRFLLVAGRTQEIIRVNTKSCIWLLQAITFVVKSCQDIVISFELGRVLGGCIRCEENYTLMFVISVNYQT